MRTLDLVVTGTGRCGTGFASRWLTSAGIPCGHEQFYYFRGLPAAMERLRLQAPELVAEASWMAAPFLDSAPLAGAAIIHLVRHPRGVIESNLRAPTSRAPAYWKFLVEHCPEADARETVQDRAAAKWIYWNRRIEKALDGRRSFTWRIEDGELDLLRWLFHEGLADPDDFNPWELFDHRTYNHKAGEEKKARLTDLAPDLRAELQVEMGRYGYEWR